MKMSSPRLSFCIPTYNFGEYIGQTLDNILHQASSEVEVVIVDGASTDSTQRVIDRFRSSHPNVLYHRRERNMGVDQDLAKAVDLAQGEYCWLMSSDDVLAPHAIEQMLSELESNRDIYLCNRTECDRNLMPIRSRPWFTSPIDEVWSFGTEEDIMSYCKSACSLGALFSYISSIIVRREKWNAIPSDESLAGSHYAHVFRLFRILLDNGSLKYVRKSLVYCRGGNDSFATHGMLQRIALDLGGYERLAAKLFKDPRVQDAFKAVMRREHPWYGLGPLKVMAMDPKVWDVFEMKLLSFGYTRQQLSIATLLAKAPGVLAVGRVARTILERYRLDRPSRSTKRKCRMMTRPPRRRSLICI
jgi:abequosyltransferase